MPWSSFLNVSFKPAFSLSSFTFIKRLFSSSSFSAVRMVSSAYLIPGLGRSPREGDGYLLQYSCLENPRYWGAWWAAVYGVAQSRIWLKRLSNSSSSKEPLDESERGEWKVGLELNIQKTKIMASGPIISWQKDGETVKTVTDFIFLGSKITVDSDCNHKIKRFLFLRKQAVTNLDSRFIKKKRHHFADKGP